MKRFLAAVRLLLAHRLYRNAGVSDEGVELPDSIDKGFNLLRPESATPSRENAPIELANMNTDNQSR